MSSLPNIVDAARQMGREWEELDVRGLEERTMPRPGPRPDVRPQPSQRPSARPTTAQGRNLAGIVRQFTRSFSLGKADTSQSILWGAIFLVMSFVWLECMWSFILTAASWGWVKLNRGTDIFSFIVTTPLAFLLGCLVYIIITRFEMEFWPTKVIGEEKNSLVLVFSLLIFFVLGGLDFGGVDIYVNRFVSGLNVTVWFWNINFPPGQWYSLVVRYALCALAAFGTERGLIFSGKRLISALGV